MKKQKSGFLDNQICLIYTVFVQQIITKKGGTALSHSQGLNIKNALYLCIQACLAVIPFILTYYQPEEGIYKYQLTDIPEMEHKFFSLFRYTRFDCGA